MKKEHKREEDFFEAIPGTFIEEFTLTDEEAEQRQHEHDAKLTAIITITLTILVAIAMGVLFLNGVDTIKSVQVQSGSIVP